MPETAATGRRQLEHVTDAFIEAWGPSLETALDQAGLGFEETIVDLTTVSPTTSFNIHASGHDELELVYNWLEELLLMFEVQQTVFSKLKVDRITKMATGFTLEATGSGEQYSPKKHRSRVEVKGVTYHEMSIQRSPNRVTVRFLLDL